jgi:hypothetical protein
MPFTQLIEAAASSFALDSAMERKTTLSPEALLKKDFKNRMNGCDRNSSHQLALQTEDLKLNHCRHLPRLQ